MSDEDLEETISDIEMLDADQTVVLDFLRELARRRAAEKWLIAQRGWELCCAKPLPVAAYCYIGDVMLEVLARTPLEAIEALKAKVEHG